MYDKENKYSLSDTIYVKLSDIGKQVLNEHIEEIVKYYNNEKLRDMLTKEENEESLVSFGIYEVMNIFRESCMIGCENPIEYFYINKQVFRQ